MDLEQPRQIRVMVREADYQLIERAAERFAMPVSTYIRMCAVKFSRECLESDKDNEGEW